MRIAIRLLDADNSKLQILVQTNEELDSIRQAFRAACFKKRTLVKSDVPAFIPHLIFAFRNIGTIRVVHEAYPVDITYSLQYAVNFPWKHKAVMLRIKRRTSQGKDITLVQPFFEYLGGSERKERTKGNQYTRAADIRAREDALQAKQRTANYTPDQRKMRRQTEELLKEHLTRKDGAKRRRNRELTTKKYTLDDFPITPGLEPAQPPARIITIDFTGVQPREACSYCGSPDPENMHSGSCPTLTDNN